MATQSLIWTCLPNGLADGGRSLRVSLLLSPRLDAEQDPQRLASFFPEWQDWPKTLARATVTVHYGQASVSVPLSQTDGPHRIDERLGAADSAAWQAVFHGELFVRGFRYQDLSTRRVVSYDTLAVEELVSDLYRDLARTADGELPKVTDLVERPDWKSVIDAVRDLDRQSFDEKERLRDPNHQFQSFREDELPREGPAAPLSRLQLFHTPPMTPRPRVHQRTDDSRVKAKWLEYERNALPTGEQLEKQIDFHQVVAAMNQYPVLLRRMGLVVDLLIDRDAFGDSADDALWAQVSWPTGGPASSASALSPVTHARLDKAGFTAVSNPFLGSDELRVDDGLVDLDPKRFRLVQVDVDGAGLKLMNFARTLDRKRAGDARVDSVSRREQEPGAPTLATAGLMLVHRNRGLSLEQRFQANRLRNDAGENVLQGVAGASPPELWAEDLVRGYRMDVWDDVTKAWHSLCQRTARYELRDGAVVVDADPHEEGTVRLAATRPPDDASNTDLVYLHEAVVSWAGWSLAAPIPGRAILPDDSVDKTTTETVPEVPAGIRVKSSFRALPGSLPRLRFGRRYWMRARTVDLAGNSLEPRRDDFGPEEPQKNARPYLRYEPIKPPVIALVRRSDGTTEKPSEGESMERIAIRSFNDTPADNTIPTDQVGRRYAVPPQASVRDAEHHGELDVGGRVDASTFDLLANQKDRDAKDPAAAMVEELLPMQGPLDPVAVDTVYAVYKDEARMTYLTDPLTEVIAARFLHHPNITSDELISIPLFDGANWPEAAPFKIELREDPSAPPTYEAARHTLVVPLPKGVRAWLRLSVRPSPDALRLLAAWNWLSDADKVQLESLALAGRHWMLTPWRTIELVHATQRPLIAPRIIDHVLHKGYGDTSVRVRLHATCSIKSTDRMDLLAEWHEPIDDPEQTESELVAQDRARGDVAFPVKITAPEHYTERSGSEPRGGYPDHTIIAEDEIGVGLPYRDVSAPKPHEFGDTRYRRIEYWFDATTRYREFLPRDLLVEDVGGVDEPTEKNIKVTGPRTVSWIRNSSPPPAPRILYVVPTFGWERTENEQGKMTRWRRGGGLRIYLDRPWMETGYGEMLAVVLPPSGFTGDPETQPSSAPYKKYVTQWGNDPIWKSPFVSGTSPRRDDFPLARTAPDPEGKWLPANAPDAEKDQPPGDFQVTQLLPPHVTTWQGQGLDIAPHDVRYDTERRLWYCDVEVDQGNAYWPFIRLALARYQPSSLPGAHLSEIVLSDFMPLTADRWLNLNPTDEARTRRLTVYGRSYSDSSGRKEAAEAPSYSLYYPLSGQGRTVEPTEIAGETVVEVWVERLDETKGEDFGWERIDDAIIRSDDDEGSGLSVGLAELVQQNFVPSNRVLRARKLQQEQRFDILANESLIESLWAVSPLWSGTVTLPAKGADGRHRLVVAEYEEYAADDEFPYDATPEKKTRRLVFVEHVEL